MLCILSVMSIKLKCLLIFIQFSFIKCSKSSSLTFVIDDTRSMYSNIQRVIESADAIMDIVLNEKSSQIKEIVLVTFNDPEVKLRIKTSSRQEFKNALSSIEVDNYFNNDCPEMALTGVKLGLEESLPGSYIYVLTDATAKDYRKVDTIKVLCEKTQSQVVFILTGDCQRPNGKGYKVYHEIAAASSGHVFRVKQNEVSSVLRTIQETIKGKQRLLTRKTLQPNVYSEVPFSVDDDTEYLIVSVSGTDVTLDITGPSTDMEKIMWTTNGKVVKILDPAPGDYVAWVSGTSPTSVAVHTKSDFSFQYGFSEVAPIRLEDTSPRPAAGMKNYLAMSISDPNNNVYVQSAQMLDMDENVVTEIPLKKISDNLYTTSPFVVSDAMFKVAVKGITKTGMPVRKISKKSFQPEPPNPEKLRDKVPEVKIAEGTRTDVEYGSSLILTCRVTAYPNPTIVWKDDKDNVLQSKTSVAQAPYNHKSYLQLSNVRKSRKYTCHASNSVGRDMNAVNVTVGDPFHVVSAPPEILNVKQGETAKLRCDITSTLPMQITWYRIEGYNIKTRVIPSNTYSISRDETELAINTVDSTVAGKYSCKAFLSSDNEVNKEFVIDLKLSETVVPVIDKTTAVIEVEEIESVTIPCKILQGVPAPELTWQCRFSKFVPFETPNLLDKEITQLGFSIFDVKLNNSGDYKCIAENSAGRDEHVTALVVLKKPEVTINEGTKLSVKYGSTLSVTCTVLANPEPSIEWKDGIGEFVMAGPINYSTDFKYSKTLTINNMKQSNVYYCISQNKQGQEVDNIDVTVLSPFKINSYPGEITNGVYGTPTKIKCDITSHLPMIITWTHVNDKTKLKEIIRMSNKYTISWDQTELTINAIDLDSVGEYTCRASLLFDDNEFKAFTTQVKLQGSMMPTILDKNVTSLQIEENSPAIITCKVAEIGLKPSIRWEFKARNGYAYVSIPQYGEKMRIPNAVMHNTGYYRCIAENAIGSDDKITELIVTMKPVVMILEGRNTNVSYGSELVLTCRVLAYSATKIIWTDSSRKPLYSQILTPANQYEYTSVLTIPNVKKSEEYYCLAENTQGNVSANIDVTVSSPFKIIEYPEPITNAEYGKSISINCDIRSNILIKISWYRFNTRTRQKDIIKPSDKYTISWDETTLTINHVDLDFTGKYSCKATLLFDDDMSIEYNTDVKIKGLSQPKISKNVTTVEVQENSPASIDCSILESTPKPKITWQFKCRGSNEFLSLPGSEETMQIQIAVLNNAGWYKCIAENAAGNDDKITELIVKKIPVVTILEGTKINTTYGKELSLTCTVIAYPDPIITWNDSKGSILTAETLPANNEYEYTSLLRIPSFKKSAQYYCSAVNSVGESAANIEITVSSIISVDPEVTMNVEYGKSVTIQCGVQSQMPIVITWNHVNSVTKETEIVRASEKYSLPWDRSKLTIRFMNFDLTGKYSCKGSLLFDPEQYEIHDTNININGLIPPKFNKTHNSIEVKENSPATVECKLLEGTPKPKISWEFKSRGSEEFLSIPGFEEFLRIPSTVLQSAGFYKCIAESSAGKDNKTTELIVVKKPLVMIAEGKKVTLSYGIELILTCKVQAYPVPTITWSSDEESTLPSEALPESNEYEYVSRLRIDSAKKTLNYSCKAENSQGIVTESVEVVIEPAFKVLEYPEELANVEYGKEHKMRCVITSTFPMRMQWFRTVDNTNTMQISHSSDEYDLALDHTELTIKFMDSDLVGKYTCKASLLFDAETFKAIDSNIFLGGLVAPLLQQAPEVTKVKVNTNVTLFCKILKGNPRPTITWYFKKARIDKFVSIDKSDEELHIPAVTFTHAGYYKCVAVNEVESDETTTELIVEDADTTHTTDIHNINLIVGDTRTIKCLVPHTKYDSIKWYMNGKYTMVTKEYLTLRDVDISMAGNYMCQVISGTGSHSDTYIVNVGYKPVFINYLDTTIIDWNGSGELDCNAKAKPEAQAKWTYNGVPLDTSTDTFDLKISGWGQFICNISNVHGSVTRTFNVTSNGCLINRNVEATPYTPLLLNRSSTFPLFETVNEYLVMKPRTFFKLSCHDREKTPNSFQKFPEEYELDVICNHEDTFWVDEKLYKYSDFRCKNKVLPVVIKTENKCLGDNTELIRVGFNVKEFIEIYKVCLDTEKVMPLYTRFVMRGKNTKIDAKVYKWFRDTSIGYRKINYEYTCENALSTVCYARSQLVSPYDVPFGPAQTSTFIDHLNTIPLWKPCEENGRMTWQAIEDNIRANMNVNSEITVWSGASEFVRKGEGYIPRFLWKIVMFEESDTTVIIYVNDPTPKDTDILCNNTCDGSSPSWIQSTDKYTYCCNLDDFFTAFKLPESIVSETVEIGLDFRMASGRKA